MWFPAAVFCLLLLEKTDFNAEGLKALEARKYDSAAAHFTRAIEADAADYSTHFHLALAYSFLGKDAQAISEYKKTLELKPRLYQAELNLGMLLLRQKQVREAVPYFRAAVEQKPQEFRPRLYLAEALLATEDFSAAEQQFQQAAALDPKSAPAQLGLGRAQAGQKHISEAAAQFQKAVELDASFNDALLELASVYEKNGQPAQAIALYEKFPENVGAQERLGELLVEMNRAPEAIPRLEKAVQKEPTPANQLALAKAYLLGKEPAKALPLLEKTLASDPGNYDLHMIFGRAIRDQKQYATAAREFLQATKLKPESREAWNELASALILGEQYPQAIAVLDRLKAMGAETPAHLYFRAIILDKMKQYQPALESYQSFLLASRGESPDEEFKARQRVRIIRKELSRR